MDLYNTLHQKNIRARLITGWSPYLHARWEEAFAGNLTSSEKQEIYLKDDRYYSGYLWHIFSYEKVDHLTNDQAIRAFHDQSKKSCYVFYQHSDDVYLIEQGHLLPYELLSKEEDVYVVDSDFTWTFVITHETETCGPYFAVKSSQSLASL